MVGHQMLGTQELAFHALAVIMARAAKSVEHHSPVAEPPRQVQLASDATTQYSNSLPPIRWLVSAGGHLKPHDTRLSGEYRSAL